MKKYDSIAIGTGSVMSIVSQVLREDPEKDIAVIEKDAPGGICLTRGCIPSKMILYPAEIVKHVKDAGKFGIDVDLNDIDKEGIMERMGEHVDEESGSIGHNLKHSDDLDFYHETGTFVDDYTLEVGGEVIKGDKIFICSGSEPLIPPIDGLESVDYLTSEELLRIEDFPESIIIIGGGYIAAEYGFFLSMMGTDVTIVGRNPQFVPDEEPKISEVLEKKLSEHMDIYTGHEAVKVREKKGKKGVMAKDRGGKKKTFKGDDLLMATGRKSNAEYLQPEKSGIETDERGWIRVNEHLETSKENIWALGDAVGKYLFKHVANYEAEIAYSNAFEEEKRSVDYHAVPHAVFTYPEVASVGMKEEEAREEHDVLVGYHSYEDTAKGMAMKAEDYFVKVIVEKNTYRILGAHIVGPQASTLIQEIVNLMYAGNQNIHPIYRGMHIHPALSEVVEKAFYNLHSHEHHH